MRAKRDARHRQSRVNAAEHKTIEGLLRYEKQCIAIVAARVKLTTWVSKDVCAHRPSLLRNIHLHAEDTQSMAETHLDVYRNISGTLMNGLRRFQPTALFFRAPRTVLCADLPCFTVRLSRSIQLHVLLRQDRTLEDYDAYLIGHWPCQLRHAKQWYLPSRVSTWP
jgi:hypothetical protein